MIKQNGMSVVEVIMAVSIIAIMFAILTPALINSSQRTAITGQTVQASLVLNFFVRQIVGGNNSVLAPSDQALSWDYGKLSSSGLGLADEKDLAKPDLYKVTVSQEGSVKLLSAESIQYRTEVCFAQGRDETCVDAVTLGPSPTASGNGIILPGIN